MQLSFLKEMPKFKTPEEELSYLRAHVAEREKELIEAGRFENANENAIKDVISEYREKPKEEVLHKGNILSEKETESIIIQYFKTGQIYDIKDGTPLYKSLNMTLFEITLPAPKDEADKGKSFKEFIGAMEQFYAGMHSISESKNNEREN